MNQRTLLARNNNKNNTHILCALRELKKNIMKINYTIYI